MIPVIKTKEDILTVMRQNRRWRRRQRIFALRQCVKTLGLLRQKLEIDANEGFSIRRPLLLMLKREEKIWQERGGEWPLKKGKKLPAEKKVITTGPARKMAKEHDVPLAILEGTGKNGKITVKDVREYVQAQ